MPDAYAGFEPQVGEIRALRTFRVGPGGRLYPLFRDLAWVDGTNTAQCAMLPLTDEDLTWYGPHRAPEPDCSCGLYAHADELGASEYPQSRHVLAVVSCWGRVIAGTRGLRSEHARVDALWLSDAVPAELLDEVRRHYPTVEVYGERGEMLRDHPVTELDCYESPAPRERSFGVLGRSVLLAVALVVGLLPREWISAHHLVRLLWAVELAVLLLCAAGCGLARRSERARGAALLYAAAALWVISPYAGYAGWFLLRLPVLQIAYLGRVHRRRLEREAATFPARI